MSGPGFFQGSGNSAVTNPQITETLTWDQEHNLGTTSVTTQWDLSNGNKMKVTVDNSPTITIEDAPQGPTTLTIRIIHSGAAQHTITWPGTFVWPGGIQPVLSQGAGKVDVLVLLFDGTNYYANIWLQDTNLSAELARRNYDFALISDLKAATFLQVGDKVRVLGRTAVGDAGSNDYEIVAAGTGTHDDGRFIDLAGSGLQAKGLFLDKSYRPEQWGAVGDAVTNDRTPVTNCFNAVKDMGGGDVYLTAYYFIGGAGIIHVHRTVSIIGVNTVDCGFLQGNGSYGHVLWCDPEGNTVDAKDCPQSLFRRFRIRGRNANFITINGTVTNTDATVTVDDTTGIGVDWLVEANGVPAGTRVLSITNGTTLEMTANATATVTDKSVGFRENYRPNLTTTSGSKTATVSSATGLQVGMRVDNANVGNHSYIEVINGTTLTLNRAATTTGTLAANIYCYNCGIFAEDHTSADDYNASRLIRGPIIEDVNVRQMPGDAYSMRPGNGQLRMRLAFGTGCRGRGVDINTCHDSQALQCGFGGNWQHGMIVSTSATFRSISTECWQTFRNDAFYEFRSQANQQLTFSKGEINGSAYVEDNSPSFKHHILFEGVNFKFTQKNLRYTDGAMEGYVHVSDTHTVYLNGCYFHEDSSTGEKPTHIVNALGDSQVLITGVPIEATSYSGSTYSNNVGDVAYMVADDTVEAGIKISRLRLDRVGSAGSVFDLYYDNVLTGGINLSSTRPTINGLGTTDGIQIGQATWNNDPLRIGPYRLWVDSSKNFRIKNGAPTSETDGDIIVTVS